MNREQRRELTKRKWLSRVQKVYDTCGRHFVIPIGGIKARTPWFTGRTSRRCESITDFLENSIYAKTLRNCTVPFRSRMMQFEYKKENRKVRRSAKKQIEEGLQEWEDRHTEEFEDDWQDYIEGLWYQAYLDGLYKNSLYPSLERCSNSEEQ